VGSRLEAKKNLPTPGTNFNPGPPLHTALPSVIPPSQAVAPARSQLLPGSIAMHPEQDFIVPHRGKSYPSR